MCAPPIACPAASLRVKSSTATIYPLRRKLPAGMIQTRQAPGLPLKPKKRRDRATITLVRVPSLGIDHHDSLSPFNFGPPALLAPEHSHCPVFQDACHAPRNTLLAHNPRSRCPSWLPTAPLTPSHPPKSPPRVAPSGRGHLDARPSLRQAPFLGAGRRRRPEALPSVPLSLSPFPPS